MDQLLGRGRYIGQIIRDGKDAVDLGLFRTEDESLTDCPEAWDAALELIRLAPINWPHD